MVSKPTTALDFPQAAFVKASRIGHKVFGSGNLAFLANVERKWLLQQNSPWPSDRSTMIPHSTSLRMHLLLLNWHYPRHCHLGQIESIKADGESATDACAPGSSSEQEAAVQLIVCIKRRLMSLKPCQDSYGRPESDAPQEGTHAAAVNDDFENDRPASTAVLRVLHVPMHDSQCT
jgi:hypothetical protein